MGWQWHQLNHMQAICTSLQKITLPAPNQSDFYGPDALPDTQPTASKHWRPCPLWENVASSTKPEVVNISQHCHGRTEPRPNATSKCNLLMMRCVLPEICCMWTDRHNTDSHHKLRSSHHKRLGLSPSWWREEKPMVERICVQRK